MEKQMERRFTLPEFGYEVVLGKYAAQADSAAWFQMGGTVLLATVVSAASEEFPGFLPLTVDYRELFSAAGKIPGGYFKREGKFSDREVLTSRLIDRSIRPLFPESYFDKLQILTTVYSVDKEHSPEVLSLLATSIALTLSKIPFMGPVGAVEVARVDGNWVFNPIYDQIQKSDVRLVVAGTDEGICMVEGSANEISEDQFVDAMFKAHEIIKKQVAWQKEIQAALGLTETPAVDKYGLDVWKERSRKVLTADRVQGMFKADKLERAAVQAELKELFVKTYEQEIKDSAVDPKVLEYVFDMVLRDCITDICFTREVRVDGRSFDQVRKISTEVGLLPFAHGSALFNRGRTQALVSATLGGGQDRARNDSLMGEAIENSFMLHYNFPPFSVGEVRPQRGPGRREIGHGYLAASALERVLPSQEKFPYTIRIVADMLESDGSTSMATVCGGMMSLMDAGVPVRKMVSGIAMGLLKGSNGSFKTLTDIAGIEDAFGLMDFKVAGTEDGITAIQMDIKYKGGLEKAVFVNALAAAKKARLFIMGEMKKVLAAPRGELSPLVPQFVTFKIPTDKIGAVIGTGGKVIRDIIDKTGTTIDIEDDGLVKIFGHPGAGLDQAVSWVKIISGNVEIGSRHAGTVKRVSDFGLFVEIAPGVDGLVHVSMLPRESRDKIMNTIQVGEPLAVEVADYEAATGRIRLRLAPEKKASHDAPARS